MTNGTTSYTIIQIIPATGYMALYELSELTDPGVSITECQVVCWALIEDGHAQRRIVGMVIDSSGTIVHAEMPADTFISYIAVGASWEAYNVWQSAEAVKELRIEHNQEQIV